MDAPEFDGLYTEILEQLSHLRPPGPRSSVDDNPRWLQRAASQLTQVLQRWPVSFLDLRLRTEEESGRVIAFTADAVVDLVVAPGQINDHARTVTSVVPRRYIERLSVEDDDTQMILPTPGKWSEGQIVRLDYPGFDSIVLPLSDPLPRHLGNLLEFLPSLVSDLLNQTV